MSNAPVPLADLVAALDRAIASARATLTPETPAETDLFDDVPDTTVAPLFVQRRWGGGGDAA